MPKRQRPIQIPPVFLKNVRVPNHQTSTGQERRPSHPKSGHGRGRRKGGDQGIEEAAAQSCDCKPKKNGTRDGTAGGGRRGWLVGGGEFGCFVGQSCSGLIQKLRSFGGDRSIV